MDDADVKEQNYKSLRKFCNKDGPREEKHFSNLTGIMTFKLFFKTVYNYDSASDETAILDIVNTLNIFTLTKEPKKNQIPSARPIILLLFICYPFFRGHILEYKKADDRVF